MTWCTLVGRQQGQTRDENERGPGGQLKDFSAQTKAYKSTSGQGTHTRVLEKRTMSRGCTRAKQTDFSRSGISDQWVSPNAPGAAAIHTHAHRNTHTQIQKHTYTQRWPTHDRWCGSNELREDGASNSLAAASNTCAGWLSPGD